MSQNKLLTASGARSFYTNIVPAYQAAFAETPWNEISRCPNVAQQCAGGLSPVGIGQLCLTCNLRPASPAYEPAELEERFEHLAATRPTAWYVEQDGDRVALAAVAWLANAATIAAEKYKDIPDMASWLNARFTSEVLWLDEVFADRTVRERGNLARFGVFVAAMAAELGTCVVAYRTIEPRMTAVAERDFGEQATIFTRNEGVPDRRDFVIINISEEAL